MMNLFDKEQILETYAKDIERTTTYKNAKETAERMIKKGKMSLEEIADCVQVLSLDEIKELEAEVMQLV